MPQGGAVSLEMIPLLVFAYRRGAGPGLFAGAVYGILFLMFSGAVIFKTFAPSGQSPWLYSFL